jgi:hypothetical protein
MHHSPLHSKIALPGDKDFKMPQRKDCTVEVNTIVAKGHAYTTSYFDWNMPNAQKIFMQRVLKILKDNGGQMHYFDFMKEYNRRYTGINSSNIGKVI